MSSASMIIRLRRPLLAVSCLVLVFAVPVARAADELGIFFDPAYTLNSAVAETPATVVEGYLVVRRDDWSGGVLAWECRVDLAGPGIFLGWQVEGDAINAATPPEFAVGMASPLPPAEYTLVATFELFVSAVPDPIELSVEPIFSSSLPGEMAFIDGTDPGNLRPLTPIAGEPVVATVNGNTGTWCGTDWVHVVYFGDVPVGESMTREFYVDSCGGSRVLDIGIECATATDIALTGLAGRVIIPDGGFIMIEVTWTPAYVGETVDCILDIGDELFPIYGYGVEPVATVAPTPVAARQDGAVELSWPANGGPGAGYHVYRRDPTGREDRLTVQPLTATGDLVRYTDRPAYPAGTALDYSYAIVKDGAEWARSPAVEVVADGLPVLATRLLPNVPNPFNPQTRLAFTLERGGPVRLSVYDVTGRLVTTLVDEERVAGPHEVTWDGRDARGLQAASGVYLVRLVTGDKVDQRRIMMLK